MVGGAAQEHEGDNKNGYYIQPTILKGHNKMRVFQEEIFGPVVSLTTFKTTEEAIEIANVALFLASDEAAVVSGAIVTADSGLTAF